jgi:benzoyl-CoA-dihydrodiol lyase
VQWRLVDSVIARSRFAAGVEERIAQLANADRASRSGIVLDPLTPSESEDEIRYRHLTVRLDRSRRLAELVVEGPTSATEIPADPAALGADWYPLRLFREIDDAILRLRFNYPEIGVVQIKSHGDLTRVLAIDRQLRAHFGEWLVRETVHLIKRVLKRLDLTAKSIFAIIDEDSCFGGFMLELALAADRIYMKSASGVEIGASPLNNGAFPMGNGLSRLATRFLHDPERARALGVEKRFDAAAALEAGLVTAAPDDLDWTDEVRLAIDERLSLSPDALTGMEASLRFAGPETMETKIFGRLSAWQNWIFQRPNAIGERGALKLYGHPERPQFDWRRT